MNPRVFIQTMIALASASLGLVAALAWNEAIKATLAMLGLGDSLAGLYTYAILATVIAVAVLIWLGRLAARAGRDGGQAVSVKVCFEAGYDGFWLARFLLARGIETHVLDPASFLVSRRGRRAKMGCPGPRAAPAC